MRRGKREGGANAGLFRLYGFGIYTGIMTLRDLGDHVVVTGKG